MNKFQFIKHLMDTRKFSSSQKERFFNLVSEELSNDEEQEQKVLEDIQLIKKRIGMREEPPLSKDINDSGTEVVKMTEEIWNEMVVAADAKGVKPKKTKSISKTPEKKIDKVSGKQTENENSTVIGVLGKASSSGSEIRYVTHKNLPSFLRSLNANDYTKFLTHSIDSTDISNLNNLLDREDYDFDSHLKKIKEVFDVLTEKESRYKKLFPELRSYYLPKGVYMKIKQYIYGPTWSLERKIKMYWSHSKIQDWTNENHGMTPSANEESLGYEGFYFHSSAFNKQMSFSDLILFFKNEIHIRSTNSLYGLINDIYNNPELTFKASIDIENNIPINLDFYTDVEKLRSAIKLILELIVERHYINGKPKVIFDISLDSDITFSILHFGNQFQQNKDTLRFGKSFCNLITLLNGVCEINLFATFSDSKSYHLKLWEFGDKLENGKISKNDILINLKEKLQPIMEDINGVQYNLTFNRGL